MIVDDLKDSADSLAKLLGLSEAQDRRRTEEAGFNDHMVKPVDPGALMKLLARLP